MINQYPKHIALTLLTCIATVITADASYASIQERQQAVIEQYQSLIRKWKPALDNPSDAALKIIINQKEFFLQNTYDRSFNDDERTKCKNALDVLNVYPVQFMCDELDTDIKTIFGLIETARILNMDYVLDPLPFQELRAAIDILPCMIKEQQACIRAGTIYKYFLAFFGGVLIANHFSLFTLNTSSNA